MSGQAPYHLDIAEGPAAQAVWLQAADGTRIRAGIWPAPKPAQGTVFLLPGRSEYLEKYGRTAGDLVQRGYGVIALDWRGQGLSVRKLDDPMVGHVVDFDEYQADLDALLALGQAQALPQPWYLLSHSMGGCIALRRVMRAHPFKAAVFSAPMWGILMAAWMRPFALAMSSAARWLNFDQNYAPGTSQRTYVVEQGFHGNTLTTDAEAWAHMRAQALAHPELTLGGPSLGWLRAAMNECHALAQCPSPDLAALTGLGSAEKIVDTAPIHLRMSAWPRGRLSLYAGAEHEILMESPQMRRRFLDEACALFAASR